MDVLINNLLVNGLRTEFNDTYTAIRNRQSDSRLAQVMDLGIGATNRYHDFAYIEAGPHVELWKRGDAIPQDGMQSVSFRATVHNYARRVPWHADDREDDQTQSLLDSARMAGESFALNPERFFFELLVGTADLLPAIPTAPDGSAFFATTHTTGSGAGGARFGVTSGNLLTGSGITTISTIQADYYSGLEQFMLFQDGKGQPLLAPETVAAGVIIIHAAADLAIFEQAFKQVRQGVVYGSDTAASTPSNVIRDASRNVDLWASPRLATGDWYMFLKNPPKKPTFRLDRAGVREETSMRGDNNGDHTRTYGEEYIQWHSREGAGIALPYGALKINN